MRILCNGMEKHLEADATVGTLLAVLSVEPATVVVEHNGVVLTPDAYATRHLTEGDRLELVRFVGGG